MAVTVTKPGPKLRLKCRGCKAELEFEFEDLQSGYFQGDYIESGPQGVGVECPTCCTLTEFKDAPDAVVRRVWKLKKEALDRGEK